jgi:ubiquinone/menaquinone biosynthesis C-methylase UbiE
MAHYAEIKAAGGDTAMPMNLGKRMRIISEVCDLSKVRFLDCGCGAGEYVFALRDKYGTDAWGIEYLADKVAKGKSHELHADRIKQGDLQKLDEPDASFDVALLNEVLEHVPDDAQALREVQRVLKPGGKLIIFSPNRLFPFETHGVRMRGTGMCLSPAVPLIPYIPLALGRLFLDYWARNYWPSELRKLVRQAGFATEAIDYIWQTFENISGKQPMLIKKARPIFRSIAAGCERTPLVRQFGISQVLVARKVGA